MLGFQINKLFSFLFISAKWIGLKVALVNCRKKRISNVHFWRRWIESWKKCIRVLDCWNLWERQPMLNHLCVPSNAPFPSILSVNKQTLTVTWTTMTATTHLKQQSFPAPNFFLHSNSNSNDTNDHRYSKFKYNWKEMQVHNPSG